LTQDGFSTIEVACLPERNVVFVVDDDAMMLKSVARLLRQLVAAEKVKLEAQLAKLKPSRS
jgi:FixJ family two-component response regulator